MTLQRERGAVLWHQIETVLRHEIETGVQAAGEKLPTEPELMRRFGVSRATIRQALGRLEQQGLVRAEQGRGTFVRRGVLNYPISRRPRFSKILIEQGFDPGGEVLAEDVIPAPPAVASVLKVPEGTPVAHRRALATADGVPVSIGSNWLPDARVPGFLAARNAQPTLTATLAGYDITDYVRVSTEIEARLPTAEEAHLLQQPQSLPVFVVTKLDAEPDGTPLVFGHSVWSAERVAFSLKGDQE